nr:retrovirus-related Pol polyprotein from transposon TNT 1-94 [Tanacetum cinerariifolium]
MHQGEHLDSDVDSDINDDDNTIPYHQYQSNNKVKCNPTNVSSVIPDGISVITILDDLRSQLAGHIKANKEHSFANDSLKAELERYNTQDSGFELAGFSNADYAGCKDTFKSTFGGAQFLGEKLLTDYGFHFNKIPIYSDSKSAIAISCNPVQHSRTKHIAVRYYFIKEHVEKGTIELYFVKTDYQLADIFTIALPTNRFNYLVRRLGMHSLSPKELERLAKSQ